MWQSCFAHTCGQIHLTLFCCKFTFVKINEQFWVKYFQIKHCLCKKLSFSLTDDSISPGSGSLNS